MPNKTAFAQFFKIEWVIWKINSNEDEEGIIAQGNRTLSSNIPVQLKAELFRKENLP